MFWILIEWSVRVWVKFAVVAYYEGKDVCLVSEFERIIIFLFAHNKSYKKLKSVLIVELSTFR